MVNKHALQHFVETQHTFALELQTQRVWDYVGDNYVHRLIQNRVDGKLVEFSSPYENNNSKPKDDIMTKLELQYDFLLTSQLELQRQYYQLEIKNVKTLKNKQITALEAKIHTLNTQLETASAAPTSAINIEKLQAKVKSQQKKIDSLQAENKTLEQFNKSLVDDQKAWKEKVEELQLLLKKKEEIIQNLQDEAKDLMFFIEAGKQIENKKAEENISQEELQEGTLVINDANNNKKTPRKTPKKGKK